MGMGVGPRKGDSDISEVGCWPFRKRLRESPVAGVNGVAEDDEAAKSSDRAAASRCETEKSVPDSVSGSAPSNLGLYLLKLRSEFRIVCPEFLNATVVDLRERHAMIR